VNKMLTIFIVFCGVVFLGWLIETGGFGAAFSSCFSFIGCGCLVWIAIIGIILTAFG